MSLDEWRRRRRAHAQNEPARAVCDDAEALGDEVILRACGEFAAGRAVEVHLIAAAIVVNCGDAIL